MKLHFFDVDYVIIGYVILYTGTLQMENGVARVTTNPSIKITSLEIHMCSIIWLVWEEVYLCIHLLSSSHASLHSKHTETSLCWATDVAD